MLGRWYPPAAALLLLGCGSEAGVEGSGGAGGNGRYPDEAHTGFLRADAALDLDCIEADLPLDVGDCETSLATVDELSRSPRCWPEADPSSQIFGMSRMDRLEVLAARASGKVVADQAVYERIIADMGAMRALWPELVFLGEYIPGASTVLLETNEATILGMRTGTYTQWDCLNRLFRVTHKQLHRSTMAQLSFGGVYDVRVLSREYEKLPGITRAYPNIFAGDWGEICVIPGQDEWHYIFDEASGDCPSGCIDHVYHHFVTLPTGEVKRDGRWEHDRDEEHPEWFARYWSPEVCH